MTNVHDAAGRHEHHGRPGQGTRTFADAIAPDPGDDFERAVPDLDGEPAIADTLYSATEELEHAAPELRSRADEIAAVLGPLVHVTDPDRLQIDDPDPAALLPDDQAGRLATLLTDTAKQVNDLAAVLADAADQADGLAAVLTDERAGDDDEQ